MNRFLYLFVLSFILFSCLPDEPTFNSFRRVEVLNLLSNQDSKRWILNERVLFNEPITLDSCDIPQQLIFNFTSSTSDTDSLFYVNPEGNCDNSTDTLRGFWFVPPTLTRETPIDTVVFVWKGTDTAYFQIENLNPENLSISTFFEEDSLFENFIHIPPIEEAEDEEEEDEESPEN